MSTHISLLSSNSEHHNTVKIPTSSGPLLQLPQLRRTTIDRTFPLFSFSHTTTIMSPLPNPPIIISPIPISAHTHTHTHHQFTHPPPPQNQLTQTPHVPPNMVHLHLRLRRPQRARDPRLRALP